MQASDFMDCIKGTTDGGVWLCRKLEPGNRVPKNEKWKIENVEWKMK
jgi:hypothetical protein